MLRLLGILPGSVLAVDAVPVARVLSHRVGLGGEVVVTYELLFPNVDEVALQFVA